MEGNVETIRSEFKNHWFKIAVYIFAAIFLYNVIDDVRAWLRKPNQTVINQTTPAPINFGTSGQQQKPPEVYVNVHPVVQEQRRGQPRRRPRERPRFSRPASHTEPHNTAAGIGVPETRRGTLIRAPEKQAGS
jgi:hypothetical protein